jgi:disulfide bond formation protein DsbB
MPFLPAVVLIGVFLVLLVLLLPEPTPPPKTAALQTETASALASPTAVVALPTATLLPPTEAPAVVAYAPAAVDEGRAIYSSTCSACHGLDARGIPGLGKNLIESTFVHGLSDEELLHFIIVGRDPSDPANTTGIPMPARGGNPSLTDDQLRSVIAFLRTESGSAPIVQAAVPTGVTTVAPPVTAAPRLEATILPTTIPVTPQPFSVEAAYAWSCAGCHGVDGTGNPPFADGFTDSPLLADRAALLSFLVAAHPPTDPAVEFPHPPRGGYPELSDVQLEALTDYVIGLGG